MINNRQKRLIPKLPLVPSLNNLSIELLTQLCFRKDNIQRADLIFVFGTSIGVLETIDKLLELLKLGLSKKVLITGGMPQFEGAITLKEPESQTLYNLIRNKSPTDVEFYLEGRSTNTLENVIYSSEIIKDLKIANILFLSRSFTAGRCFLTLIKQYPKVPLFQSSYHMPLSGPVQLLTYNNWFTFKEGRQRIWGEYLRIREYSKIGFIAYEPVKEVIAALEYYI